MVYLADGVEVCRNARHQAGVREIDDRGMDADVLHVIKQLGASVADVKAANYTATELQSGDKRRAHHYAMPLTVTHLQHAKLHQAYLAKVEEVEVCKKKIPMLEDKEPEEDEVSPQEK